jgi:hypothetical protein
MSWYQAPLWDLRPDITSCRNVRYRRVVVDMSKSKLLYDWRSLSQYVLISSTLVGLATRYYFLSECCCLKIAVLFLCGALSDERTGLQFASQSLNSRSSAEPVTIPYCLIWDSANLKGKIPIFISPRNRVAQYTPGHWVESIWVSRNR